MKQDSKHWLQWKGVREGNTMVYARPWTTAAQSTNPNYLRERFAEIRDDIAWADDLARYAANYPAKTQALSFVKDPKPGNK